MESLQDEVCTYDSKLIMKPKVEEDIPCSIDHVKAEGQRVWPVALLGKGGEERTGQD
jgi:hypothetical protein